MGGYTWFGLGTMLISEGARLKGSRFSNSLYKFNVSVEEAAELAWRARAFITQPFVMEPVVVFILVLQERGALLTKKIERGRQLLESEKARTAALEASVSDCISEEQYC
ncbi:uncharacterized protein LOC119288650 isoform X2 [Triticum dicoccoides]|uniref:uncharacterized protein LOC119288650 isoform X2 n=1 Tax=Triticum dicoccoides TaxID=85692 RepID=UPI001890B232|nr:uncharacterized protein LOC119288650 isoform X2 [Triticum dicoccoides]